MTDRIVLLPGVLALLPEYASIHDPVAELRSTCIRALAWLGESGPVRVLGTEQGTRVARHLMQKAGVKVASTDHTAGTVVVGNGSARLTKGAPGHLHPEAVAFNEELRRMLLRPDPLALARFDLAFAVEVWADVEALRSLGGLLTPDHRAVVDLDATPFGVQYWVVRWSRRSACPLVETAGS